MDACPAVWDPYTKKKEIELIQKTQNVALRFIFRLKGRVSFTEMREREGIDSLQNRRRKIRTQLFLKTLNKTLSK